LGQHLIEKLRRETKGKADIRVIDCKRNPYPCLNIEKLNPVTIHYTDIRDYQAIEPYFHDIDVVYHLAGLVSFYKRDKKRLFEINVQGTENAAKASFKKGVKRFIHISSVAGIGFLNDPVIPADETLPFILPAQIVKYLLSSVILTLPKLRVNWDGLHKQTLKQPFCRLKSIMRSIPVQA